MRRSSWHNATPPITKVAVYLQVIEDTSPFRPVQPDAAAASPKSGAFLGPNIEDAVFRRFQATPQVSETSVDRIVGAPCP